ncbi:response regulator [Megalodesulfovibrio gigas]|uniref:Putative response regulator receiver protein n=1 Tax=Megalodesulfovibrio gigas (strain ATCC 19364 / DSM 1382 / NCIMB 9332 / VKM B-1759) TaxID=1121448 RepID=T2G8I1_MEGG1|nr:response regulator [Megalodesulfovibrio gigas]AGW12451.1 putative response regulator receiver protein [Megalodesulfovibrio gigas DSM 1382 = ATCC 19364]
MTLDRDKWRILLVDDEVEFVSTLAERLSLRDIEPEVVHDGQEALARIHARTPHVVILDMFMPGMKGLDVLRTLRFSHPQVQVVLLTGHGATRDAMEGMRLGAFDYMVKPINIDDLLKKITEAMDAAGFTE